MKALVPQHRRDDPQTLRIVDTTLMPEPGIETFIVDAIAGGNVTPKDIWTYAKSDAGREQLETQSIRRNLGKGAIERAAVGLCSRGM